MPQIRTLGAATALVAAGVMVLSSVAAAHGPHHRFGPYMFDNIWIDRAGENAYEARDGSRDKIVGLWGDDVLDAGDMRDVVKGNTGDDEIYGGPGSDRILGGGGADVIDGGDQADKILGERGDDEIDGGAGRDVIRAGRGADVITDTDNGPDFIKAGPGDDTIFADNGARDYISCGLGTDTVTADAIDRIAADCENVDLDP